MNNLQKRITGITLSLLIMAPLFLFLGFSIKQKLVQFEMREKMENSRLQTITLKVNKLHWVNEGKEILLDGKLFDVESFTVSNTDITLTGLFDGKEDRMQQHLRNFLHQKNSTSSPLNQLAFKFLFFPIYPVQNTVHVNDILAYTSHRFFSYAEKICQQTFTIITPPPRA